MAARQKKQLYLHINSNIAEIEGKLDKLEQDRRLNLKVNIVGDDFGSLLARLEKVEVSAKEAEEALKRINSGSKSGNKGNKSLQEKVDLLNQISQRQTALTKLETKLQNTLYGNNKDKIDTKAYQAKIKEIQALKSEANSLYNKVNGTFDSKKDPDSVSNFIKRFDTLNASTQKFNAEADAFVSKIKNVDRATTSYDKIGSRLTDYFNRYETQLTKNIGLYNRWQTLLNKANTGNFASVAEANREFAAFRTQARAAGIEIESFGTKLQKTFGTRMRSALSGYGVFALESALRDIIQNAIAVDTAMTELKKVTSETDTVYTQFLEGAEQRAQRLGATLSEVVNATADYARLGYNINQATTLADSALIYSNVGDDVQGIDDATGALISTMQGFNIAAEDSMSIVDKFNNVSNNYASSAGDIGEIVRRSAASMSAAGNTLDQTIALGVAANEVQQDADTVGTALKTKIVLMYSNMHLGTHLKPVKPKALSLQCG